MDLSITIAKEAGEMAPVVMRGDYFENIRKCAEIGYPAVELHIRDPKEFDVEAGKKRCSENSIGISTIGTGTGYGIDGLGLGCRDEKRRTGAIERIRDHIDLAAAFDAKVIVGLMRGLLKDSPSRTQFDLDLKKSLEQCLEYASETNTMIVLEAINRYECDSYNTIEESMELVKDLGSDLLKVHIDTYHMNIEEADIRESIMKGGDYIGHCHLADSNRWYPGAGHYDFSETVKALREINYKGVLAMECLYFPDQYTAAEEAFKTMMKELAK
jgi:sugar phosphate isomerase/epimerase